VSLVVEHREPGSASALVRSARAELCTSGGTARNYLERDLGSARGDAARPARRATRCAASTETAGSQTAGTGTTCGRAAGGCPAGGCPAGRRFASVTRPSRGDVTARAASTRAAPAETTCPCTGTRTAPLSAASTRIDLMRTARTRSRRERGSSSSKSSEAAVVERRSWRAIHWVGGGAPL
jgi:hypothetical protein